MAAVALLCWHTTTATLTFVAGDYYFDNAKQHYENVKLIAGSLINQSSHVFEMEPVAGTKLWKTTISQEYNDIDFFAFANSQITSGDYAIPVGVMLDSLRRNDPNFSRTHTQDKLPEINADDPNVFCPLFDINYSEGYWRPLSSYSAEPSGTLPIIHITTQDSTSISSRDYYINGSLWIDGCDQSLGTEENPLPIEIKGRGNWTWTKSYKKPYRLKFTTKQSPLGLEHSRHFVLLAHNEDYSGYLRNTTGFKLSSLMQMPYTPSEVPVELIINGEYEGLYFLCEKIRVESGRVEIFEQADMEEIPSNVTGGWLLQLNSNGTIVISQHQGNDPNNPYFSIISESPEILSSAQLAYIHDFLHRTDSCIYVANKDDRGWEQYLDMNSVARFYIIHEVLENVEAFSGSLYMYKDLGDDEKLHFGPVWDFDNSFFQDSTTADHFIFDYGKQYTFLWIKELLKFPRFQQAVKTAWQELINRNTLTELHNNATEWRSLVESAEVSDRQRWPFYASSHEEYKPDEYMDIIARKINWLNAQWLTCHPADINLDGQVNAADITALYNCILYGETTYINTYDVNQDGYVNSTDITAVYNSILDSETTNFNTNKAN